MNCPPMESWHGLLDGTLQHEAAASCSAHAQNCRACRWHLETLRGVQGFLEFPARWEESVSPAELDALIQGAQRDAQQDAGEDVSWALEIHEDLGIDAPEPGGHEVVPSPWTAAPRTRFEGWIAGAAAAAVVAFVVFSTRASEGDPEPVPASAHVPEVNLLQVFEGVPAEQRAAWLASPEGERMAGPFAVARALSLATTPRERLTGWSLAALRGLGEYRAAAEAFALAASEGDFPEALRVVADFGGRASLRALLRIDRARPVPPQLMADALIRTNDPRSAPYVRARLEAAGLSAPEIWLRLHELPGRPASEELAGVFLAGADGPELRGCLRRRPESLELLRQALPQQDTEARVRILGLLGEAGDASAVPAMQRLLSSGRSVEPVVKVLGGLCRGGSEEALELLVKELPLEDDLLAWWDHPQRLDFEAALAALPEPLVAALWKRAEAGARTGDVRKSLAALAMSQHRGVLGGLQRWADKGGDVRALMSAVAILGDPRGVPLLDTGLRSGDRVARRLAIQGLAGLEGDEAARRLSKILRRSGDRATVFSALRERPRWAASVFVDGLAYWDSREECREALAEIFPDADAPRTGDASAWRHWLGYSEQSDPTP